MKIRLIVISVVLIIALTACEKDESINGKKLNASFLSFTDCKTGTKSTGTDTPSLQLAGQAGNKLLVKLENTEFCCGTDSVSLIQAINGKKINIEIIDNGPFTYCYCPHDLEFTLGPLDKTDYELTLIESEHAYSRDTFLICFNYTQNLDTTVYRDFCQDNSQIKYLTAIEGGCNIEKGNEEKSATGETDTVFFSIRKDTVDLFVGLNYICCAPFTSDTEITNDSIFITIADTCPLPDMSCYCKCMCYYTWDFLFTDFIQKKYNYKIILIDPGKEKPNIFKEGEIDLSSN